MTVADAVPELIAADENHPRIQAALADLRATILDHYPSASFTISHGDDPEGIYLWTVVDVEDFDEVADVITGRLLAMQVEEGLPVYVIPVWPDARIAAYARREKTSWIGGPTPFLEP